MKRRILTRASLVLCLFVLMGVDGSTQCGGKGGSGYNKTWVYCQSPSNNYYEDPPASEQCGSPGLCACTNEAHPGSVFCGECPGLELPCRYCGAGYECVGSDPCAVQCKADASACPSGYPVNCGNGSCCPDGFPICCSDKEYCGKNWSGCADAEDENTVQEPEGQCNQSRCTAGTLGSCSDGTLIWYELNGRIYGPCAASNSTCINNAAQQASRACIG